MTSLMLHVFPMLSMWNMRWYTMPYEATLPEKERRFLDLDTSYDTTKFFVVPFAFYLVWVVIYFIIHFVVAKERIAKRNYDTMFRSYAAKPHMYKLMCTFGKDFAPVLFIVFHLGFWFICHCASMLVFYSYWWHTFCILFWLSWSLWNAAGYYMDYFAKKYDLSLQLME